jgi:hypothetical protein
MSRSCQVDEAVSPLCDTRSAHRYGRVGQLTVGRKIPARLPLALSIAVRYQRTVWLSIEATLDAAFAALADPTRRGILERLGRGDTSISELAGTSP